MKIYLLENETNYSAIVEACSPLERNEESMKVDQFVCGTQVPRFDSPLKIRIHFRKTKPKPLPDFHRGTWLSFVSARGKAIIEEHFGEFVQFVPTEVVGFGVEHGRSWAPAGLHESPFSDIPPYFVMHICRTGDVIDTDRSTIIEDSIGELPGLLPVGQFHDMVFRQGVNIPPMFALPYHVNYPVVSGAFVEVARRENLRGFRPVEAFDTGANLATAGADPCDEGSLVSLKDAIVIASSGARPPVS